MKCSYIILMFLALVFSIHAQELQDNDKPATLLDTDNIKSGGYGAFEMHLSDVKLNGNKNTAVFIGGRGGWIINSTFSIGGGGYGMVSKYTVDEFEAPTSFKVSDYDIPTLQVGYGGVFFEYTHMSGSLIHFTVNTLIGAGGASYSSQKLENENDYANNSYHHEKSAFFVLEPGATIEFNILPFFRISTGFSYRYVNGVNLSLTESQDLRSLSYNIAFKFGKF